MIIGAGTTAMAIHGARTRAGSHQWAASAQAAARALPTTTNQAKDAWRSRTTGSAGGAACDLVAPQLGRHRHRRTRLGRLFGTTVAVGEAGRGHPVVEGRLVGPAGANEPGVALLGGLEQLEALYRKSVV